jgi:[acyl-carrier-protein] S-malonyltransferase
MDKVAFLFPGQGSQSLGMLEDLAKQSPLVKNTFDEASQVVGVNLWQIAQEGPKERLDQTEITQPAMLAADIATWRVWKEQGGFDPDLMAGHSLGEYAALVAAGTLDFGDTVAIVAKRASLMQQATPEGTGAMAAILGPEELDLAQICKSVAEGQVVSCANFNSPGQTVIAGHKEAVERACAAAKDAGARRAVPLPVSVPSHCELMRAASVELELDLFKTPVRPGGIPVIHNADVLVHSDELSIYKALVNQLWKPVRWSDTIRELDSRFVRRYVECGPGAVLTGLNRRMVRDSETISLASVETMQKLIQEWG